MKSFNGKIQYLKIITVANGILGILIFVALVFFAKGIMSAVQAKKARPALPAAGRAAKPTAGRLQDYESLLEKNPFGVSPVKAKEDSPEAEEAALSDVKLMGTIADPRRRGYAVFLGKDGKQSLVKTGESVFGAGELVAVEEYQASVRKAGRLIKIPLVDMVAPAEMESLKGGGGAASGAVRSLGKGQYVIDQKALQSALDNPAQIMTDAKLVPNMAKGKQQGFVLREVKKGGIFDSLGMQNGDVLLRINDFSISNPENALQAFTALRGMDKIELDIIRSGNRMAMNYQVK